jgi:hypothetical protein
MVGYIAKRVWHPLLPVNNQSSFKIYEETSPVWEYCVVEGDGEGLANEVMVGTYVCHKESSTCIAFYSKILHTAQIFAASKEYERQILTESPGSYGAVRSSGCRYPPYSVERMEI